MIVMIKIIVEMLTMIKVDWRWLSFFFTTMILTNNNANDLLSVLVHMTARVITRSRVQILCVYSSVSPFISTYIDKKPLISKKRPQNINFLFFVRAEWYVFRQGLLSTFWGRTNNSIFVTSVLRRLSIRWFCRLFHWK